MTLKTVTELVCECGATGKHVRSENDQPYSKEWVRNDLEGFTGGGDDRDDTSIMTCQRCGRGGAIKVVNKKG